MRDYREIELWKDVTDDQWNSYAWQMRNKITNVDQLSRVLHLDATQKSDIEAVIKVYKMEVSPHLSTLMNPDDKECPIRKQWIPSKEELIKREFEHLDAVAEASYEKDFGVIHRYPDRIAFMSSDVCGSLCRFCTRKRSVLTKGLSGLRPRADIDKMIHYVAVHREIRDILITGGDALSYSNSQLEYMLSELYALPNVEIVRLGTRLPVSIPQRIDEDLVAVLRKFRPLYINIQVNHPKEIVPETKRACEALIDAGAVLGNQAVLLRGVNDQIEIQKKLAHELLKMRVRPYYLYQCDLSVGLEHFRTSISKGLQIMEGLIGHTSGLAVPHYIVEAPGGGGKVPLHPTTFVESHTGREVYVRNFENKFYTYVEP
jgi:lysine 2,3-aminomutase